MLAKELISLVLVAQDGTRTRASASAPSFRTYGALLQCRSQAALHLKAVLAAADDSEYTRAQHVRREAAARAETREIELAKLKGDLVETAAVRAAGVEAGTVLRAMLENLPDQIAPMLGEGDPEREARIRARLAEHIGLALTEIADKLKTLSEQTVETQV